MNLKSKIICQRNQTDDFETGVLKTENVNKHLKIKCSVVYL